MGPSSLFARDFRMYLMAVHMGGFDSGGGVKLSDIKPELYKALLNPASDATWQLWSDITTVNTESFAVAFPYAPMEYVQGRNSDGYEGMGDGMMGGCNLTSTAQQIQTEELFRGKSGHLSSPSLANRSDKDSQTQVSMALERITGHLIRYPLGYLSEDYLLPPAGSSEALIDASCFM